MNRNRRITSLMIGAVALVACGSIAVGCGGSDDTSSSSTSTATTGTSATNTVESELQSKLDDAAQACTDAAGKISNSTAQGAAKSACDQLKSSLSKEITSAADQAKGNLSKALDNLAADCQKSASKLSAGQAVASSFCDAISASADSASSGNG